MAFCANKRMGRSLKFVGTFASLRAHMPLTNDSINLIVHTLIAIRAIALSNGNIALQLPAVGQ